MDDDHASVREEIMTEGSRWLFAQGVSTVLLACILIFMGYDKVYMQPARDTIQREAYEKLQQQGQTFFTEALDRVEKNNEKFIDLILGLKGQPLSALRDSGTIETQLYNRLHSPPPSLN